MKKVLNLKFKDVKGKTSTLSLNEPKDDLTKEQVNAAMDLVLSNNIFATKNGDLNAKTAAQIVTTEITEFEIA